MTDEKPNEPAPNAGEPNASDSSGTGQANGGAVERQTAKAPTASVQTVTASSARPVNDKAQALTTFDGARDIPASQLPVEHDPETTECPVCQYRFKPGAPRL